MGANAHDLASAWGTAAVYAPADWLDLSKAPSELPALEALLRAMPDDCLYVRVTGSHAASGSPRRISLRDLHDLPGRLSGSEGSLHLQAIHLDRYDDGCAAALRSFTECVARVIPEVVGPRTSAMLGIFLSTPGAVAPFHADQEHNFLFQVMGDKHVRLFDPADLELFPSEARERLACHDVHVLDGYDARMESRAHVFHLAPGTMIYHPPMGPHWGRHRQGELLVVDLGHIRYARRRADAARAQAQQAAARGRHHSDAGRFVSGARPQEGGGGASASTRVAARAGGQGIAAARSARRSAASARR